MALHLVLPWPPSANAMYRRGSSGGVHSDHRVLSFRRAVATTVLVTFGRWDAISMPVAVRVVLNPPSLRRWDVDNRCKCLLDALTKARVWEDDQQVHDLHILRGPMTKRGQCTVDIAPLEPGHA